MQASDITVTSASGISYGPVTLEGSGTSYDMTLAQPINGPDRVAISISNPLIAGFYRRIDVLPGDVNDDGVVNVQDLVAVRNQIIQAEGALPSLFGDINGDGLVNLSSYVAVRKRLGTRLPIAALNPSAFRLTPSPRPSPSSKWGRAIMFCAALSTMRI